MAADQSSGIICPMEILRTISLYTEDKKMPFLIIGGHAINSYGISRQTGDLDLLVPLSAKSRWVELMCKLKYEKGQDDDRFARFRPDSLGAWPIDLMFVNDSTFEKLFSDSVLANFGIAQVRVVSARHLATLKIHALKHLQAHRYARDYSDLVSLLRSGQTTLTEVELRELCQRYANLELFNKLKEDSALP